jgi:hypothetical protein
LKKNALWDCTCCDGRECRDKITSSKRKSRSEDGDNSMGAVQTAKKALYNIGLTISVPSQCMGANAKILDSSKVQNAFFPHESMPSPAAPGSLSARNCSGQIHGAIQFNKKSAGISKKVYTMQQKYARIRSFVSSGLSRIGCVKDGKTLKYLGAASYDSVVAHIQKKMDQYNTEHIGDTQMSFHNIELDHIKPVQRFGLEVSHYTNIQPMLKKDNRGKAAKWSSADESFWRVNIQQKPIFTHIYTNNPENL